MTDARRTPFRDKWKTFAEIHKAAQEDWVIALLQRLCISVQNIDWTSLQFDETKLTVAQNLVCVEKYYKRWKEEQTNANNSRSKPPQPSSAPVSTFQPSSAPASTILKNASISPPQFGSALIKRIEGMDISETEDNTHSNISTRSQESNSDFNKPATIGGWTSPNKQNSQEILNYTIESKFKAIKAVVERIARGIQEKRNVNFVLLWLLIENRTHVEEIKYNTINITSLMELISQFRREVINSNDIASGKENGDSEKGDNEATWKISSPATAKGGWNRKAIRVASPPDLKAIAPELKEIRLPPSSMLRGGKSAEIVKEGWMKKQTNKSRTWKRRYFILSTDAILAYFNCSTRKGGILGSHGSSPSTPSTSNPPSSSPPPSLTSSTASSDRKALGKMKASVDIWKSTQIGAIRDPDSTVPPVGTFGIESPDITLRLWCDTEKEMEEWLETLLKLRAQSRV